MQLNDRHECDFNLLVYKCVTFMIITLLLQSYTYILCEHNNIRFHYGTTDNY